MFGGGRKKSTPTFTIRDNSSTCTSTGSSYSDNNNNHGNKMRTNNNTTGSSRYSDENSNANIISKEKVYKFGEADSTNATQHQQQQNLASSSTAQSSSLSSMYQSNNNNNNTKHYPRANSSCSNASSGTTTKSTTTTTTTTTNTTTVCVGTEAIAKSNIERNKKEFNYPKCGFIQPIEHSLLYNMIKEPTIYPSSVLIQHIQEEDYYQYIELNDIEKNTSSSSTNGSTTTTVTNGLNQNQQQQERPRVSYAQLSALLALSAENHPATYNNKDNILNSNSYSNTVSEVLGKVVIKFIISYSNEHDLDRSIEIQDLLHPVEKYATRCSVTSEFKAVAALYAGYTVTVLTANPLPGLVGFAVWNTKRLEAEQQIQNIKTYQNETARKSNIETCSLLDECE